MSFTPAQTIASYYQSPGADGIGFARFASSGTVTPELWDNIARTEETAKSGAVGTEEWAAEMAELREALADEGIHQPAE
jgi:hypothetical protein